MLATKNRLQLGPIKKHIFKRKLSSDTFTLLFTRRESGSLKAAITVSKKIAPKAVDRNRIKRLVAESLRDSLELSGDLLVKINKNISGLKKQEVGNNLDALLKKL